jgi:hypothetical protein
VDPSKASTAARTGIRNDKRKTTVVAQCVLVLGTLMSSTCLLAKMDIIIPVSAEEDNSREK